MCAASLAHSATPRSLSSTPHPFHHSHRPLTNTTPLAHHPYVARSGAHASLHPSGAGARHAGGRRAQAPARCVTRRRRPPSLRQGHTTGPLPAAAAGAAPLARLLLRCGAVLGAPICFPWRHLASRQAPCSLALRCNFPLPSPPPPPPPPPSPPSPLPCPTRADWPAAGRIEYRDVTAIYRSGLPPVLRDLTFTLEVAAWKPRELVPLALPSMPRQRHQCTLPGPPMRQQCSAICAWRSAPVR